MMQSEDLEKLRASLVIGKLSGNILLDVLKDGEFEDEFGVHVNRNFNLKADLAIGRDDMFAAFRVVADGGQAEVTNLSEIGGSVQVILENDGAAVITTAEGRFRFECAELLSSDVNKRLGFIETLTNRITLSIAQEEFLRSTVAKPDFAYRDFESVLDVIDHSRESYLRRLDDSLGTGGLSVADLVPTHLEYWKSLLPDPASTNLQAYCQNELANEWRSRLAQRPAEQTFVAMSHTFASPALVPIEILKSCDIPKLVEMMDCAKSFASPFALTGTLAICADLVEHQEMEALGLVVLERLVNNPDCVKNTLDIYSATFVLATSFLSKNDVLRNHPPFWRRLAASTHASLVVQACGFSADKQDGMVSWAWNQAGAEYTFAVLREMQSLPRWCPEWIAVDYLEADVYGRILNSINPAGTGPISIAWVDVHDAAEKYSSHEEMPLFSRYPAVLEGDLPIRQSTREAFGGNIEYFDRCDREPSMKHLLVLQPLVHGWGYPPGFLETVRKAIAGWAQMSITLDDQGLRNAMAFVGAIAVQIKERTLADEIVELVLLKFAGANEPHSVFEAVMRIVQCSGVGPEEAEAARLTAVRLDRLAAMCGGGSMSRVLHDYMIQLASVSPTVKSYGAKAGARARLGTYATG